MSIRFGAAPYIHEENANVNAKVWYPASPKSIPQAPIRHSILPIYVNYFHRCLRSILVRRPRLHVDPAANTLSNLLPPLLLTPLPKFIFHTTDTNVLNLVLFQPWQTLSLSPGLPSWRGVKAATQTGARWPLGDAATAVCAKRYGRCLDKDLWSSIVRGCSRKPGEIWR